MTLSQWKGVEVQAGADALEIQRFMGATGGSVGARDAQARTTFSEVETFDPGTDRWTARPPLQPERHAAAAAAIGAQAYGQYGVRRYRAVEGVLVFRLG